MRQTANITYKSVGTQTLVDRGTQTAPILGGRMFSQQKSLSKFPVPPLQQTLYKYLLQLQPLVGPEEYEQTKKVRILLHNMYIDMFIHPMENGTMDIQLSEVEQHCVEWERH